MKNFICLFVVLIFALTFVSCTSQEQEKEEVTKVENISFEVFDLEDLKDCSFYMDPFNSLPQRYLDSVMSKMAIDTIVRVAKIDFKNSSSGYENEKVYFEQGYLVDGEKYIPYMLKTSRDDYSTVIQGFVGNYRYDLCDDLMEGDYEKSLQFSFKKGSVCLAYCETYMF